MPKGQTRITVWLDTDFYQRFLSLHPAFGATTSIVKRLLMRHVQELEGKNARLIKEIEADGE